MSTAGSATLAQAVLAWAWAWGKQMSLTVTRLDLAMVWAIVSASGWELASVVEE